jgi:hypothetical protein
MDGSPGKPGDDIQFAALKTMPHTVSQPQFTPSFFCRLDDEVVYWNTSRLSG